jgi:adenine phosphoribosyltransferase
VNHSMFELTVGSKSFTTPLRDVGGVRIAYLDFLCDTALVRACADTMVQFLPARVGAIVVPESGAIPLGFALASTTGRPLVVLRKAVRGYMGPVLSASVRSVSAPHAESLLLETSYLPVLRSSPVTLVDTVASSGNTLRSMNTLMSLAGVVVGESAVAFTEGDQEHGSVMAIGNLPVFRVTPSESDDRDSR